MSKRRRSKPACPVCGAPGIRIVFGLPDDELRAAADRGQVLMGGCVIAEDDYTHGCAAGHAWRRDDPTDVRGG